MIVEPHPNPELAAEFRATFPDHPDTPEHVLGRNADRTGGGKWCRCGCGELLELPVPS